MTPSIFNYYLEYRYLAVKDQSPRFAGIVDLIEAKGLERSQLVGSLM